MKTTFRIVNNSGTYSVEDNGITIAQWFPTREMAILWLWNFMGKVSSSHYTCSEDGSVFVRTEDGLK